MDRSPSAKPDVEGDYLQHQNRKIDTPMVSVSGALWSRQMTELIKESISQD